MAPSATQTTATSRVVTRLVLFYIVVIGGASLLWRLLPHASVFAPSSLDQLFGGGPPVTAKGVPTIPLDEVTLAVTVAVAMIASILLSLPVAWVYLLTRAKRGYQQSVVQLLIILPLVVSGIVLLVKYSIALAFSLAGIVAAVRFRNTLDDSKDAVYVFLATAVGLAAAVNLPVAAVISILFNVTALLLWYFDFGSAPVELDGRIAEKRLRRAKELARTGTFVARIDDEVFRNMTRDQLEGVADRALRRAHSTDGDGSSSADEAILRITTSDLAAMRRAIEPRLQDYTKSWRLGTCSNTDGVEHADYFVQLKKRTPPDELLSLIRAAGTTNVIGAEFR
ncbi:MAG: DUF4956 domain-containing protein [Gemmatimonadota bacterium]|nr:DUF4956 domain-containing protein [Gemmatimonadota bacterium]